MGEHAKRRWMERKMVLITKEESLSVTRAQKCHCEVFQMEENHHWDGKEHQGEESRYPFLLRSTSLQMLDLSRRKEEGKGGAHYK